MLTWHVANAPPLATCCNRCTHVISPHTVVFFSIRMPAHFITTAFSEAPRHLLRSFTKHTSSYHAQYTSCSTSLTISLTILYYEMNYAGRWATIWRCSVSKNYVTSISIGELLLVVLYTLGLTDAEKVVFLLLSCFVDFHSSG